MNPVTICDQTLEEVSQCTYLGSVMSVDAGMEEVVKGRKGKSRAAFYILKRFWKTKNISLNTKLNIYNSNVKTVKTVLLYGSSSIHFKYPSTAASDPSIGSSGRLRGNVPNKNQWRFVWWGGSGVGLVKQGKQRMETFHQWPVFW